MSTVVLVLHLLVALGLVALVLMQRSEGGALGIGGGSSSLISGRGAADLLARITGGLAALFFITSISLTLMAGGDRLKSSVIDEPAQSHWFDMFIPKAKPANPAAPTPAAPVSGLTAPEASTGAPIEAPTGDIAPAPTEAVKHAGPIDGAPLPLTPSPAAAKPAAPAPVGVMPKPKPAVPAAMAPAESPKPKPKPIVGGTNPAPASAPESR